MYKVFFSIKIYLGPNGFFKNTAYAINTGESSEGRGFVELEDVDRCYKAYKKREDVSH